MRSIIHAAFSTALVHYTTRHDLPHPGFVVLDSPVLTYREPDEADIELTHNVVEHFYRGLLDEPSAQVVQTSPTSLAAVAPSARTAAATWRYARGAAAVGRRGGAADTE